LNARTVTVALVAVIGLAACEPPRYIVQERVVEQTIAMSDPDRARAAFPAVRVRDNAPVWVRSHAIKVDDTPPMAGLVQAKSSRPHLLAYLGAVMLFVAPAAFSVGVDYLFRSDAVGWVPLSFGIALAIAGGVAVVSGVSRGGAELRPGEPGVLYLR
jgi:hypothetical protein